MTEYIQIPRTQLKEIRATLKVMLEQVNQSYKKANFVQKGAFKIVINGLSKQIEDIDKLMNNGQNMEN